jgi:hypothetical protein
LLEVGDRIGDHPDVLFERGRQDPLDVQPPALAEDGDYRRVCLQESLERLVRGDRVGPAGGAEGGQLRVGESEVAGPSEELGVLGVGAGPAALDVIDAELVELAGDPELVLEGEGDALALRAVTQGGVVDGYSRLCVSPPGKPLRT